MISLKLEHQWLTPLAGGLVVFLQFFSALRLKARLTRCFVHYRSGKVFGRATLFLSLIVHLLLGCRSLRDSRYYQDDPLVQRLLGLRRLPDVATLSRMLKEADARSVANLRDLLFERLDRLALTRITLDFDGSVLSTTRPISVMFLKFARVKRTRSGKRPEHSVINVRRLSTHLDGFSLAMAKQTAQLLATDDFLQVAVREFCRRSAHCGHLEAPQSRPNCGRLGGGRKVDRGSALLVK